LGSSTFHIAFDRSQDIYIILQPTANRGGLTFTQALIAPTPETHLLPLSPNQFVSETLH
jgi:hypothetical protein